MKKVYQAVLAGNLIGIKNTKANIIGSDLDNIVRTQIKKG
jgi:Xaa-Pro aminopeptidase